jgi:TIR domain/Predicted nucleotide-binding protein containing TIR-like domain
MPKPEVFISSSSEGLPIAAALAEQLKTTATVTVWPEASFQAGKSVVESLTEVAERSDFAVFVLTPDEATTLPFTNAIFELGFFAGRLGLSRTLVIVSGDHLKATTLPSDLTGVSYFFLPTHDLRTAIAPAASVIRKRVADLRTRQDRRSSIEYYSCFISYSWSDQDFAARLYDDLKEVGVRPWLDAKELKVGDPWREQIDRAIQAQDKVLLILSQSSISSSWVSLEVKNALRLEHQRQKTRLFPIRLDDAIFNVSGSETLDLLKEKQIADFSHWENKRFYQRAFSQLVRDLTISASVESERHS